MKDSNLFVSIVDTKGKKLVINKRYIVKIEENTKGFVGITLHVPTNPSIIEYHTVYEPLDYIERLVKG